MILHAFQDLQLSALGFGAMRLPVLANGEIDAAELDRMVDAAIASGINYFDTAYPYHGGNSETAIGKSLSRYPRESWYLADKFPGHQNVPGITPLDPEEVFEAQLKKCGVIYFDFYLLHNVNENSMRYYMNPENGCIDYFLKQREDGRIRHLGFSCHAAPDALEVFLSQYGDKMEFCQIQLNYLDWKFQDAKAKVDLLNEKGIPVWVMEPLRGGKLAKLDAKFETELKELRPDEAIPAWAFRFLQSTKGVTMVLSGMSNMQQLEDNITTFKEDKPLNEKEMTALMSVVDRMLERKSIPCTACHYCVSHCPQGLDIPHLISLYNEHFITIEGGGFDFIAPMALSAIPDEKRPASCLHCHSCEQVCPQQIKISDMMSDFVSEIG